MQLVVPHHAVQPQQPTWTRVVQWRDSEHDHPSEAILFRDRSVCVRVRACVHLLSRNGLRLPEKTRMTWIRGASPMWTWCVMIRGPLKNIPQQDCSILWSNMPGWNSSTCSHFLHFPPPRERTLAVSHESKQTFLFQVIYLTGPNSGLCCAVLCCGDFPSRSRAAPVTQELITNVYWDLSQARWSRNCGMMPRDLPFNQCFWCLCGLRARGAVAWTKCSVITGTITTAQLSKTPPPTPCLCVQAWSSTFHATGRWGDP